MLRCGRVHLGQDEVKRLAVVNTVIKQRVP